MGWIVSIVVHWVVGAIENLGKGFDWVTEKVKVAEFISKLPKFVQGPIQAAADQALDVLQCALGDEKDLEEIVKHLAANDLAGALSALKLLVEHCAHPHAAELVAAVDWDVAKAA